MWQRASGSFTGARSTTFSCNEDIVAVGKEELELLKRAAHQDPLRRARLCLHHDQSDKVHEMVIAFCRDSYVRPHRHINKSESFHVIEGRLAVVFFDDEGHVTRRLTMGASGNAEACLYRLSKNAWHAVVTLSEFAIIHETTSGPFLREETECPSWAPSEDDADGIKRFWGEAMA